MEGLTTITFFKFRKNKVWAFAQMGLIPSKLQQKSGLRFFKLMGTGGGIGFSLWPDFGTYAFGGPAGRDGLIAHVKNFRRQIGELKLEIKQIVGNENEVMAHWFFTGIHIGPWLRREATGKEVSADVFSFFTLKDGLISYYRLWLHAMIDRPIIFDSSCPRIEKRQL